MRISVILCVTLLPATVFAQEIRWAGKDFNETVSENARVSGDIVLGVMLTEDSSSPGGPTVTTGNHWMASDAETQVCVRIVTKDGRYEAENTYLIPQHYQKPDAIFPYGGEGPDILSEEPVAALVKTGPCGSRNAVAVPVLSLNEGGAASDMLRVFVNAAGNPVDVAWGRGRDQFTDCDDVTELDGLKYTARCDVPLNKLPQAGAANLTFFIARGNTEEDFELSVLPPYVGE